MRQEPVPQRPAARAAGRALTGALTAALTGALTAARTAALAAALALPLPAAAEEIAEIGVDWIGNDIIVEALEDPKVQGVTCHIAYFERSVIDRLSQGNWFEDPSNASIACRQTGPIVLGDIERDADGEEVFREGRSLVFKSLRVKRIFDARRQTLVYLVHAAELTQGSAKMAISSVPLWGTEAWAPPD